MGESEHLVVVVGTPVDEHLNPDPHAVVRAIEAVADHLTDGQLLDPQEHGLPWRDPNG